MNRYLDELERTGASLLIYSDDKLVFSSDGWGLGPLLEVIQELGEDALRGAIVVDKIVGRASAFLILYMRAAEAHAAIISTPAKRLLEEHGLPHQFAEEVPLVKARGGASECPFERLVREITDPEEAYRKIKAKMEELRADR